ncbi:ABC transporter permease [Lactobacillus sp. ESL0701]|uniref:FtsX-like permease family protein n=1 Tax=Lactobacillus sp. ESL0701 TaxID=2983217 RepID=UPI0023F78A8F|nr:ABC transporter permease [Lactobacillus sp. ESL0701]MDF7672811.1 ABC transporter permease [Lactobacillus sp. ESL0701]
MIWKLSLTGIKSRLKDYLVLFSGLVVASMIFYMFLTIAINPSFMSHDVNAPTNYLSFIFGVGIVLLVIITLVYLMYANSFLLNMRQHDYGMFMMLGARSSRIGLLIFCETLITGIMAAIVGIIIGFGLTGLVANLIIGNLGLHITHFQVILPSAILWTLVFFVIIFIIGAIHNARKLTRSKVIDLLHEDQKPVKLGQHPTWTATQAILGVVLLAIGYYVLNLSSAMIFIIVPVALVTIVLGSYFVFNALLIAVINFLLKKKNFSYRGIRLFTLGQLKFRLHDYTKILTVISLLFALALGAITVGLNFNTIKDQAKTSSYYDGTIVSNSPQVNQLKAKLTIKDEQTFYYKETAKYLYFNQAEFVHHPVKTMHFEQQNGQATYHLETLPTNQLDKPGTNANEVFGGMVPNGTPKVIQLVDSQEWQKIAGKKEFVQFIRVKDFDKDYPTLLKLGQLQAKEKSSYGDIFQTSKAYGYQLMLGMASGFEFMGFFLGIAFLTMLASTLMFKVLSGAASDKVRYKMLFKIGVRKRVLRRSISREIGTLFLVPGVLGVIDVLFGLKLFKALLPNPYANIWVPFLIFIILYFLYYVLTVKLYERIVLTKEL